MEAAITIKPSQFGFDAEDVKDAEKFCFEKMQEIVAYANGKGVFVWFDMESSRYTSFTLETYRKLLEEYPNIGVCLQANMKRSEADLRDLIGLAKKGLPVKVRLVKGIYKESPDIAHTTDLSIHMNFRRLIKIAFEESPANFGIAIGSHHIDRITEGELGQKEHPKEFFEIQVLKGVRPKIYRKLRERGMHVVEYVPYGPEAFAYSMRRAMKNPRFAGMIILGPFIDAYNKLHSSSQTAEKGE